MGDKQLHFIRRVICELLLGLLMLVLVAGIHMYMIEKPILLKATSSGEAGAGKSGTVTDGGAGSESNDAPPGGYCVVPDAGHGASDPGKVGCNGASEKDINLSIVMKLNNALEKNQVCVVLTRESDDPLYKNDSVNKKMADMNRRIEIIEHAAPDLAVSIHQNSYHDPSVSGPQIFYYHASEKGKMAAQLLQQAFDGLEEITNRRQPKANDNYYLLLHTSAPMVIAECGFLSNPTEADLLTQDAYQDKIAKILCSGICEYLQLSAK